MFVGQALRLPIESRNRVTASDALALQFVRTDEQALATSASTTRRKPVGAWHKRLYMLRESRHRKRLMMSVVWSKMRLADLLLA